MWQLWWGTIRKYGLAKVRKSKLFIQTTAKSLTAYEQTVSRVLVVLAVRSKKLTKLFLKSFRTRSLLVIRNLIFFFLWQLSEFLFNPKSYFQVRWELKETKNSAVPQRITPVEYRNSCEIFLPWLTLDSIKSWWFLRYVTTEGSLLQINYHWAI